MKKILLLLSLLYLTTGCENELEYAGETKIVFKGRIVNVNNQPVAGLPVSVYVYKAGGTPGFWPTGGSDSDYITDAYTDAQGYYTMIFPRPTNHDNLRLYVNYSRPEDEVAGNDSFSSIGIGSIPDEELADYGIDFGTRQILANDIPTTTVTITFMDVPEINHIPLLLSSDAPLPDAELLYPNILTPQDYENGYLTGGALINVPQNQEFTFTYHYRQGFADQTEAIALPVGTEPVTYTINY